jgi:hypothetical protein
MEWISIVNRFPKEDQECWICDMDNSVTRGFFMESPIISGFGSYEKFLKISEIKFWMPYFTPTPPGECKEGQNGADPSGESILFCNDKCGSHP